MIGTGFRCRAADRLSFPLVAIAITAGGDNAYHHVPDRDALGRFALAYLRQKYRWLREPLERPELDFRLYQVEDLPASLREEAIRRYDRYADEVFVWHRCERWRRLAVVAVSEQHPEAAIEVLHRIPDRILSEVKLVSYEEL